MLNTKEHYDLIEAFERTFRHHGRLDKESKDLWPRGSIYCDGRMNDLFNAYRQGYAYGKVVGRDEA